MPDGITPQWGFQVQVLIARHLAYSSIGRAPLRSLVKILVVAIKWPIVERLARLPYKQEMEVRFLLGQPKNSLVVKQASCHAVNVEFQDRILAREPIQFYIRRYRQTLATAFASPLSSHSAIFLASIRASYGSFLEPPFLLCLSWPDSLVAFRIRICSCLSPILAAWLRLHSLRHH